MFLRLRSALVRLAFAVFLDCFTQGKHLADSLHERMLGDLSIANHETVRRYMLGQAPSAGFLVALGGAIDLISCPTPSTTAWAAWIALKPSCKPRNFTFES